MEGTQGRPEAPEASEEGFLTEALPSRLDRCPKKRGWVQVHCVTGEVRPHFCDANMCAWCGPRRARKVAGALKLAAPDWGFTITGLGESWVENHKALSKVQRALRRGGAQVAYAVEANPSREGCHVHGWGRGPRLGSQRLSAIARGAGLGSADVRAAHGNWGYPLKEITTLIEEDTVEVIVPRLESFLERNGGRLIHTTRNFWLDEQGDETDLRGALRAAARVGAGGKWTEHPWVIRRR